MTTVGSLGLLGVPTSAGSHNPGQEKAPAAWRRAGLVTRLREQGVDVEDRGDLPEQRHRPTDAVGGVRDLDRVLAVAEQTAAAVSALRADERVPLVLGGDCTITLGVLAGLTGGGAVGLLYFDGDADLNSPDTSASGVLDTMGMTHLLGGGHPKLAHLASGPVLLRPDEVVLFGFDPAELDTGQWTQLVSRHLRAVPAPAVRVDPARRADEALSYLEDRVERVLVHFDVDVLDTGWFPLANFPHFAGLTLDEVSVCLSRFVNSPKFAGLVITEVNPDHDPGGDLLRSLTEVVTGALASAT